MVLEKRSPQQDRSQEERQSNRDRQAFVTNRFALFHGELLTLYLLMILQVGAKITWDTLSPLGYAAVR